MSAQTPKLPNVHHCENITFSTKSNDGTEWLETKFDRLSLAVFFGNGLTLAKVCAAMRDFLAKHDDTACVRCGKPALEYDDRCDKCLQEDRGEQADDWPSSGDQQAADEHSNCFASPSDRRRI